MAELADAMVLGAIGRPCRFEPCHPHGNALMDESNNPSGHFLFFLLGMFASNFVNYCRFFACCGV